jgi:hypothetical protein
MNREENSIKAVSTLQPSKQAMLPVRHPGGRNHKPALGGLIISVRICICCGEPKVEPGNVLSRDPNVCASCSSLADGMEGDNSAKMSHEILP